MEPKHKKKIDKKNIWDHMLTLKNDRGPQQLKYTNKWDQSDYEKGQNVPYIVLDLFISIPLRTSLHHLHIKRAS